MVLQRFVCPLSNPSVNSTANDLFNRLQYLCPEASQTGLSIDWGFYYQESSIFADGFESGTTSMWSVTH